MSARKPPTIGIDRKKYPQLSELADRRLEDFAALMRPLLELAEIATDKNYAEASEEYFRKSFGEVAKALIDAFFDMEETMKLHGNEGAQAMGRIYQQQIHPLHASMVGKLRSREGKLTTVEDKYGIPASDFNVKEFMHKLMFYSYYLDLGDLATALSLFNYDVEDKLKDKYFERLLPIQPVLELQKKKDIPVGRMVSKTGLFDVGLSAEVVEDTCPACHRFGTIYETDYVKGCKHCSAGFPFKNKPSSIEGEYNL